jgi:hypothetical protein
MAQTMRKMAPIMTIALLGILVAAPAASGQAALDQYVPRGNPAAESGGGPPSDTLSPLVFAKSDAREVPDPGDGSSKGGSLPFGGYPVTPFIWIVIALLVSGTMARVAAQRIGHKGASGTT